MRATPETTMCNGGPLHSPGPALPENDGADDQSHQQQGDPWPAAGER